MAYYSSSTCGYSTPGDYESYDGSGCTTSYASSEVKYVIDGWAASKFTNGEIKTVDGYGSRLITKEEYDDFPTQNEIIDCCGVVVNVLQLEKNQFILGHMIANIIIGQVHLLRKLLFIELCFQVIHRLLVFFCSMLFAP